MNAAPVEIANGRQIADRDLLARRRGDQNVADRLRRLAELGLQPHDQIEQFLALNDLRRRLPAHGGFNEAIHVGDIDPVPCDLVAINVDR